MRVLPVLAALLLLGAVACEVEPTSSPAPKATLEPTATATPVPTATPAATPTPSPTATPEAGFEDGTWIVGADIEPGLYVAPGSGQCYWARLSGFGGSLDEIIANDLGAGRKLVAISASDAGFRTSGCGRWKPHVEISSPLARIPDGTWMIGVEVAAGTYSAPGGDSCYWERLSGFGGDFDNIIANDLSTGRHIVTIAPTDAGFHTSDCGVWTPTLAATATATNTPAPAQPTWRGIVVAEEDRCSPYDSDDYPYPQEVESRIVEDLGGIYGPYTGRWFDSTRETDIEHIVAPSEAHDSGLCAASAETREAFATDLLNLTLAAPSVIRHQKIAKDAAEWLPDLNECWYADRIIQVRQKYRLTIDQPEADALEAVLSGCASVEMVVVPVPKAMPPTTVPTVLADALDQWDDNGDGRITCAEARAHGIAPVRRGHPAYQYMQDQDRDGVVCE